MCKCPINWDLLFKGIQVLIVLIGAIWAYFRFFREGPLQARIEFALKCKFLGPQQGAYLASLNIIANNKGNVEHRFSEIRLRILGIKAGETFKEFDKYPSMVSFPEKIMKGVNIVPEDMGYYFVRPGVSQSFNYVTKIPENIRFIIVRATFKYQNSEDLHSAEETFEVKAAT